MWRALCDSFAPLGRVLPPVHHDLLRSRRAVVMGRGDPAHAEEVESVAYLTATTALSARAPFVEFGRLLRAYFDTLPQSVIRAIGAREELVGPEGGLQPPGVVAGMVFAMLTRAPFSARVAWFQYLDWVRVSRMLRGLRPAPPEDESASEAAPGLDPGAFDQQYSHLPAQLSDKSRTWGVNSFAHMPATGGEARKGIAQQRGYRAPEAPLFGKVRIPAYGR